MSLPGVAEWQARGERVALHGHETFFVDEGSRDAPVLLFLHGYPTSSHDLAPALPHLGADRRVVAHDHLGFGLSDKPADYGYSLMEQADQALALWRHLGITRAHLVAHDYGTSVATELLARRERGLLPIALDSVTLCNGSMHIELADLRVIQVLLRNAWTGPVAARLASRALFARNMRRILAKPEVLDDAAIDGMWGLLERADGRLRMPQITQYLLERRRFWHRWIGALTRLDLPCHVVWGRQDPVAVPAIGQQVADETPGARLTWLEALGHYPMLEDPGAWSAAVLGFMDEVDAGIRAREGGHVSPRLLGAALAATPCLVVEGPTGPMERFRGEPDSPALRDARARLPPDMQAMAEAEAHAATYVRCTYRVRVGADAYTVRWSWDTTLEDKAEGWCAEATPTVQDRLLSTTRQCADLQGGAWWGHGLTPVPAAAPPLPAPPAPSPPTPEPPHAPAPSD